MECETVSGFSDAIFWGFWGRRKSKLQLGEFSAIFPQPSFKLMRHATREIPKHGAFHQMKCSAIFSDFRPAIFRHLLSRTYRLKPGFVVSQVTNFDSAINDDLHLRFA